MSLLVLAPFRNVWYEPAPEFVPGRLSPAGLISLLRKEVFATNIVEGQVIV